MAEGVEVSAYCWDRLSMGRWQQSLAGGDLFSSREIRWMWLVEHGVTVHSNNFCLGTPMETLPRCTAATRYHIEGLQIEASPDL